MLATVRDPSGRPLGLDIIFAFAPQGAGIEMICGGCRIAGA